VINDLDRGAQVLRNEAAGGGHWLTVKLKGKGANTDAIGAVVKVKAGRLSLLRFVRSGSSYLSQEDMRLHFGLGAASQADSLEVRWSDDTITRLSSVKLDRILTIEQR
jgi:enediyne biosynthesis protein E4